MDFSGPGKPMHNSIIKPFNGSFRDYNQNRPHNALGNVPPEEYATLKGSVEAGKIQLEETNNDGSQNIFLT